MNIEKIPKVELHLHLDGSVKLTTAAKILNKPIEELKEQMVAEGKCLDLNDYLTKFSLPISIMQTKEELSLIAEELAEDLKADGVIYAEIRFAPIFHTEKGLSLNEVVKSVLDGLNKVDIKTNLILCMMRNETFENNEKIIYLAKEFLNKGVCAIDLAGAEALFKTSSFEELFQIATNNNIPFTIHAGEADGIESINAALDFGAKRLGHGVRCIEDKDILERIKKENITLEVCPTSNIQTNIYNNILDHPIKHLYDNNIKVTINTDNRTVSNVSLSDEYIKLKDRFTIDDFKKMNLNAINASFLNEKEKEELRKLINE